MILFSYDKNILSIIFEKKKIPNAFKLFRGSVHVQYEQINKKKKVSSLFNLFRLPLEMSSARVVRE